MQPYTADEIAAFQAGSEAWERLKQKRTLIDWLTVGTALMAGRTWALREAGTDHPEGKGYNKAFSQWLNDNRFQDIHKRDRAQLLSIMENEHEVIAWLKTMPEEEQLRLNHPVVVWRRFSATQRPKRPNLARRLAQADQSALLNQADDRIAELEEEIEEIAMTADPQASSERIVKGLQEHATGQELVELVRETAELLLMWADQHEELPAE